MTKEIGNKITYCMLLVLHVGLVWWLPYFPTQDGPSHVYNLVILRDLINGGKEWGDFFTYQLRAVPNLGFSLIAYPLLAIFSPLAVEKLFVSLYIALMGINVPVFLRTFDRPVFPYAYLVFPVILNFSLLMGFYSYVLAVPLFLAAFSFAWKKRKESTHFQFVYLNLAGFIIFYCHLIPFVLFLISLAAAVVAEASTFRKKLAGLSRLLITLSPLLVNLLLYLDNGSKSANADFSYLFSLPRFIELTENLFFFSMVNFSPLLMLPASFITIIFLFCLGIYVLKTFKALRNRNPNAASIPASDRTLILLCLILVAIYFVFPFRFGEGSYFNQRFPWVIYLIALPLLRFPEEAVSLRFIPSIAVGFVSLLFLVNVMVMHQQSITVGLFLQGLNMDLPKGAFVMTHKTESPGWSGIDVLLHSASYYGIYKGLVDVGNYEAGLPYFPVQFKKTLPVFPSRNLIACDPSSINWSLYPCVHYLIGWDVGGNDRRNLREYFHVVRDNGGLTVWQRNSACL